MTTIPPAVFHRCRISHSQVPFWEIELTPGYHTSVLAEQPIWTSVENSTVRALLAGYSNGNLQCRWKPARHLPNAMSESVAGHMQRYYMLTVWTTTRFSLF